MELISHPFRLVGGRVATVDSTVDAGTQERLAKVLLTIRGERPLAPMFGITDPAFVLIDPSDVQLTLDLFGPFVQITSVDHVAVAEGVVEAEVTYA